MGITFQQSTCPALALTSPQDQLHPCSPLWFMPILTPDAPTSNSSHCPRVSLPAYLQPQWIPSNMCRITVVLITVSTRLPVPPLHHVSSSRTSRSSPFTQKGVTLHSQQKSHCWRWPACPSVTSQSLQQGFTSHIPILLSCLLTVSGTLPLLDPTYSSFAASSPDPASLPQFINCIYSMSSSPGTTWAQHGNVSFISLCVPRAVTGT